MRFLVCVCICLLLLSVGVSNAISKDCIACPSKNVCRTVTVVEKVVTEEATPFDDVTSPCANGQCERPLMKLIPKIKIIGDSSAVATKKVKTKVISCNACNAVNACEQTKTEVEKSSKTWRSKCGRRGMYRFAGRLRIWQRERRVNRIPLLPFRRLGQL